VVRERTWGAAALQTSDAWRAFFVDHLVRGRLEEPLRERLGDPLRGQEVVSLAAREEGRPGSGAVAAVAFLMASAFGASAYVMRGIADEKDSRIMEILLSSITPLELLAGKIVGLALVGLTQVAVWATSWALVARFGSARAASALGVPKAGIAILWLALYVLGFLLYSVLTGVIGSLGRSAGGESQVLAALILAPAVLPLPVVWVDASSSLARILGLVPLTAPSAMMLRLDAVPVPWTDVALSVVGLALTIPAALWGGVKLFRVGLGLCGNRPRWRVLAGAP
jgi:ABC-2 type transport system permease protein